MIKLKRVYDPPEAEDGRRVLVDRIWPRGPGRDKAAVDEWFKEIAPSNGLRKWFGHDAQRWAGFREKYLKELQATERRELVQGILERTRSGNVTLLYAARDVAHNNAVVLRELVETLMWVGE